MSGSMLQTMPHDGRVPKLWAMGVDLAEHHLGPLRFVAALLDVATQDSAVGIHVMLGPEFLDPLMAGPERLELRQRVVVDVDDVLTRAGIERFTVDLVEDAAIDRALADAAGRVQADAIVVGRRARRDEDSLVRLGEVTRRLLRRLPVPVVVVPPDFGELGDRGFGEGPIIVGVDLSRDCTDAVLFAADLATRFDRPLLLAHGIAAFHWGVSYVGVEMIERLRKQARVEAAHALRDWATPLGLGDARQHVFMGDPAKQLLQLALDEDATMLVTGSRRLSLIERLFYASVSTEVAAGASCPVAVVPGK